MILNINDGVAADLLRVVKSAAADLKAQERELPQGAKRASVESRRRSLEVVRHRLEFGLGFENPFTNPENLGHLAK